MAKVYRSTPRIKKGGVDIYLWVELNDGYTLALDMDSGATRKSYFDADRLASDSGFTRVM